MKASVAKPKLQSKLAVSAVEAKPSFAGWTAIERVGAGATSEVWRATNDEGVLAALKVAASPADASVLRIEAERVRAAARRWGPKLLAAGETDDPQHPFFLAKEWIEGTALDPTTIPNEKRTELAAIVAHALGRALAELHEVGLVHGDVKPTNVLLHGRPKKDAASDRGATLIDLGLANAVGEGARGGTARYASPELRENPEGVGPASDLFALGLVVEEILAGATSEPSAWSKLLLLRAPGARPSAAWVADRAARFLGLEDDPAERVAARIASIDRVWSISATRLAIFLA